MVKINMISVKKLIEYISMESIIKKRIVIRLDENKSLTEIPEGIVEQKCFYKINYYLFLFIALSSKRKNKIIIDIKQISNFICIWRRFPVRFHTSCRTALPCFAAACTGRACARGCARGISSCNRCRRRCSPSKSAALVRR